MNHILTTIHAWLEHHARPLERARFGYHFLEQDPQDIIKALAIYQNPDGGFGHGLEPDFYNPESNPIDTWVATTILDALNVSSHHPMVLKILSYLEHTPYQSSGLYYFRIPSNNHYPHAPWWRYTDDNKIVGYNPTASLIGFALKYTKTSPQHYTKWLIRVRQAIAYFLTNLPTEMHELRNFVELHAYINGLYEDKAFTIKLQEQVIKTINHDASTWFTSYTCKPSQLILSKQSPGYQSLKSMIEKELSMLNNYQNDDGVWSVTWKWEDYLDVFEQAKTSWMGIIAVDNCIKLKTFEML